VARSPYSIWTFKDHYRRFLCNVPHYFKGRREMGCWTSPRFLCNVFTISREEGKWGVGLPRDNGTVGLNPTLSNQGSEPPSR